MSRAGARRCGSPSRPSPTGPSGPSRYLLPAARSRRRAGSLAAGAVRTRLALGYLLPGEAGAAGGELKTVEAVVSAPMLTADLLALAEEIAVYYRAPIGTTLAAMLPPGLESRLQRRWVVIDARRAAAGASRRRRRGRPDRRRRAPAPRAAARARRRGSSGCAGSGAVRAEWSLRPPEVIRAARPRAAPAAGDAEPPRRAPVQRAILEALGGGERTMAELAERLGVEPGQPAGAGAPARGARPRRARLADRRARPAGASAVVGRRAPRRWPPSRSPRSTRSRALPPGGELLLEGVAASGKTDVYLAAVAGDARRRAAARSCSCRR